ncbi:uncharacterized protein LOC143211840 [Lasioglossum baleicum]|uniref:uncharacterized protein LOC143211840 n=1 Tax=Lasioglossum baleicum TaxID=434251 RepID=UPI003FCCF069
MQRVGHRLAPHFMGEVNWSGNATNSALACTDPGPIKLTSQFSAIPPPVVQQKKRNVAGRCVDIAHVVAGDPHYLSSNVIGSRVVKFWSPSSGVTSLELSLGAASLVGEQHPDCATRLEVNGAVAVWINPATCLQNAVDAPRQAA